MFSKSFILPHIQQSNFVGAMLLRSWLAGVTDTALWKRLQREEEHGILILQKYFVAMQEICSQSAGNASHTSWSQQHLPTSKFVSSPCTKFRIIKYLKRIWHLGNIKQVTCYSTPSLNQFPSNKESTHLFSVIFQSQHYFCLPKH